MDAILHTEFAVQGIDWSKRSLVVALMWIILCPLLWNLVARLELYFRLLTRCFGSKSDACCSFAIVVFILGLIRDYNVDLAMRDQPRAHFLDFFPFQIIAGFLISVGQVLNLSGFYKLGIAGTYMGDYFGLRLEERVTTFPFNLMDHPMYNGSTLIFAGLALWRRSIVGLVMSVFVFVVYRLAASVEAPYTNYVYSRQSSPKTVKLH